jgi:hypothetical protein
MMNNDQAIRLPDFIVIGAQKAGTSTVASYLNHHPGIHLSNPKEPFFFDRDDPVVHPHFFAECRDEFLAFDWEHNRERLLREYSAVFDGCQDGQLLGEASTSYLNSSKAVHRIAEVVPDAKLIVVMRQPTDRLYSAYWHELKMRRAIYSFERYLQFEPIRVLESSLYEKHIRKYLERFERRQMHFIVSEDFYENPEERIGELFRFLGVSEQIVEPPRKQVNKAQVPLSTLAQRTLNRALHFTRRYYTPWAMRSPNSVPRDSIVAKLIHRLGGMNLRKEQYPPMKPETRKYLDAVLRRENAGLAELIGMDVERHWW